jgi:RNA polymerase sigma-70 factor, ECF subfamily
MDLRKEKNKYVSGQSKDDEDRELIIRCRKGDIDSFGKIVQKYQKTIYNIVYRMVQDSSDTADIIQSAFIKAYEKLDLFNLDYPFFSWLHRIAVNEALNFIKQRKRIVALQDNFESDDDGPEAEYARSEIQVQIDRALEKLTPEYRVIIVLRHFGELSYQEISEILGVPEKTVKSRLFTARQELRSILT